MVKKYSIKRGMKRYVARKQPVAKKVWGQKVFSQKIQFSVPVYAVHNALGSEYYSFTTSSTASLSLDINSLLSTSTEYGALQTKYTMMKINGISIQAENTVGPNSTLTSAPPIYLMFANNVSNFTTNTAVASDGSYRLFPLSGSKNKGKYFNMSEPCNTSAGYPLTGMWRDSVINGSSALYLAMGNQENPAGLANNTSVVACSIFIQVYCQFAIRVGS